MAEKIKIRSRLVENSLQIEWIIENVQLFQDRIGGLTVESPVFGSQRGGFKWQLLLNLRDSCSSSLCLLLHKSSSSCQASAIYRFGISNTDGILEYEEQASLVFDLDSRATILFSWDQLMNKAHVMFVRDQLGIQCQFTTLDQEDDLCLD